MSNPKPAKLRRCAAAISLSTAFTFAAATTVSADVILKDHVTQTSLWNNVGGFGNMDLRGSDNDDTVAAILFTSNGGILTSISGIFYKGANGNPNAGSWNNFDFRFIFYSSISAFQNAPFLGTTTHIFSQPSNANWLTPVGNWGAYQLFRFDFDLTSLNIVTTNGVQQMATIQPVGFGFSDGVSFSAFSTGGSGAVGSQLDWYRNNTMNWGPATFQSLGAPQPFAAFRVTATNPTPCTGDVTGNGTVSVDDLLSVINHWGPCPPPCPSDINANGVVSVDDLLAVINHWGSCQ